MVGVGFQTLAQYFQTYGVMDFLLPFILVFTVVFAVTAKMPLFDKNKQFRVVIALVLALFFVIPHMTGVYPLGYDPVQVLNDSLPSISLLAVSIVMVLLIMGVFGVPGFTDKALPFVIFIALGFLAYIFGASLGWWTGPYEVFWWWSEEVTELMVMIAVFGLIVWLIVKEKTEDKDKLSTKFFEGAKNIFEKPK